MMVQVDVRFIVVALLVALVFVFGVLPQLSGDSTQQGSTAVSAEPKPAVLLPDQGSASGKAAVQPKPNLRQTTTASPFAAKAEESPFDIVYMWVNGSEEVYAANRRKYGGLSRVGDRDRDNNEFLFSLRSLDKFMPWFTGNIYFVHQNLPCWLNTDHPRLIPVHHKEIFVDQEETLPTFSSDAIEAHLHRIPGIKKLFVLINDDFMMGRDLSVNDFVLANGDPVLYFEKYIVKGTLEHHLEYKRKGKKNWLSKIYHTKYVVGNHFNEFTHSKFHFLKHAPTVLDRDRMQELWDTFPGPVARVIRYRHRNHDGMSMTFLHHHYCLLDPKSSCYVPPQKYVDKEALFIKTGSTETNKLKAMLEKMRKSPPKFFTINDESDVGRGKYKEGSKYAYQEFLPSMFPNPSQWETTKCGKQPNFKQLA